MSEVNREVHFLDGSISRVDEEGCQRIVVHDEGVAVYFNKPGAVFTFTPWHQVHQVCGTHNPKVEK